MAPKSHVGDEGVARGFEPLASSPDEPSHVVVSIAVGGGGRLATGAPAGAVVLEVLVILVILIALIVDPAVLKDQIRTKIKFAPPGPAQNPGF